MEHREVCIHTPADKDGDTFCLKCDADGKVLDDGRFALNVGMLHFLPEDKRRLDEIEELEERDAVLNEENERLEERLNANREVLHKDALRINVLNLELER